MPGAAAGPGLTERIRARAHEIFLARMASCDAESDWFRAEQEVNAALQGCCGDERAAACATMADRIRARAFQFSQQRAGDPLCDWLQAEREVLVSGGRIEEPYAKPEKQEPAAPRLLLGGLPTHDADARTRLPRAPERPRRGAVSLILQRERVSV